MSSLIERIAIYLAIAIGVTIFLKLPSRVSIINRILTALVVTFLLVILVLFLSVIIGLVIIAVLVIAILAFLNIRKFRF